jgi:hypothetical protein
LVGSPRAVPGEYRAAERFVIPPARKLISPAVDYAAVRSSFTMVSNAELDWQCPSVQSNAFRLPENWRRSKGASQREAPYTLILPVPGRGLPRLVITPAPRLRLGPAARRLEGRLRRRSHRGRASSDGAASGRGAPSRELGLVSIASLKGRSRSPVWGRRRRGSGPNRRRASAIACRSCGSCASRRCLGAGHRDAAVFGLNTASVLQVRTHLCAGHGNTAVLGLLGRRWERIAKA